MFGAYGAVAHAQTTGTSPAVAAGTVERADATGTILDYTPEKSLVLNTGSGDPVHYKFATKVQYVDAAGTAVEAPGLRKNMRVRVSYIKAAGEMTVDKVFLLE
jgi:hypothetical protein